MSSRFLAAASASLLAAGAFAGQADPPPAVVAASAPPAAAQRYVSAFDGYRAFSEQPVLPWRESNDLAGRIGGWRAYAREGQGGAPVAPAPAASMPGHPFEHDKP